MPTPTPAGALTISADYSELLDRVRETFTHGLQRAEELKVQTYWEAGRLIHEHLHLHQDEAGYGHQLMPRLARGLEVGERLIYRLLRFYEAFPDERPILSGRTKLNWTHYRTLTKIPDATKRKALQLRAAKENWNAEKLEKHVRSLASGKPTNSRHQPSRPVELLEPKRGKPGIYRIVLDGDGLAVDLGFTSYLNPQPPTLHSSLKAGSLVTLSSSGKPLTAPDSTVADLYTYRAEILSVVDGDTLWFKIWLTPSLWLKEKVRLRGIDCPEFDTPEGKAAKRFVEAQIKRTSSVTVTTSKPDKWDRYLSDVFLQQESGEVFLNNLLIENGHAHRYDKVTLADWEA